MKIEAQTRKSLQQCIQAFEQNNLGLLAAKYEISIAKAALIQAKIWERPVASVEFNLVNPQDKRFLDIGGSGQKVLAVEQLIYLGSQRKAAVQLAQKQVEWQEQIFENLLRSLRQELYEQYYQHSWQGLKIALWSEQIENLDSLIVRYAKQYDKGNIALRELARLKSLRNELQKNRMEIQAAQMQTLAQLKLLTGLNDLALVNVSPRESWLELSPMLSVEQALSQAQEQHPLMEAERRAELLKRQQLIWLKAQNQAAPTLGLGYDQRGGAFNNQVNLTLSMPLPLWNTQKGRIQEAQLAIEQQQRQQEKTGQVLKNSIQLAYERWAFYQGSARSFQQTGLLVELEDLYRGYFDNLNRGNVNMLDFVDFIERYTETKIAWLDLQFMLLLSMQQVNYEVNAPCFNLE
jgi:cobalt-zinc-cadmium efflux system outer membrane protein